MHDVDRTQREYEAGLHEMHGELGHESAGFGETEMETLMQEAPLHEAALHEGGPNEMGEMHEFAHEGTHEAGMHEMHEYHEAGMHEGDFAGEMHEALYEAPLHEGAYESGMHEQEAFGAEMEAPIHEAQEMELAAELLGVRDEAELEQFLGRLIRRVGGALRRVVRSPIGRVLGGVLRGVARRALPLAGTVFGGPLGGTIASAAGNMFGLELEGMSAEDREFEVARRFVRLAGAAVRNAALAPPTGPPSAIARAAFMSAARRYAPGLIGRRPHSRRRGYGPRPYGWCDPQGSGSLATRSGRWIRRGRNIVLVGM